MQLRYQPINNLSILLSRTIRLVVKIKSRIPKIYISTYFWNNKEIRIDGKSVFYKHFFDNNITYTTRLLYEMTNIESFNVVRDSGLNNSNFLVWTGLRQSVPLRLHVHVPNFDNILDLENFKCRDYYHLLIEQKYEKPNKWAKLREEFNLEDKQLSEAFVMPLRVANEPFQHSFQYKVLNSILYTNELQYLIFSLTVLFLLPFGMRFVKKF